MKQTFYKTLFIYFIKHILSHYCGIDTQQCQEKRQEGKNGDKNRSGQKAKPSTTTQAIDVYMGGEEKNRRKNTRKKQGADP